MNTLIGLAALAHGTICVTKIVQIRGKGKGTLRGDLFVYSLMAAIDIWATVRFLS